MRGCFAGAEPGVEPPQWCTPFNADSTCASLRQGPVASGSSKHPAVSTWRPRLVAPPPAPVGISARVTITAGWRALAPSTTPLDRPPPASVQAADDAVPELVQGRHVDAVQAVQHTHRGAAPHGIARPAERSSALVDTATVQTDIAELVAYEEGDAHGRLGGAQSARVTGASTAGDDVVGHECPFLERAAWQRDGLRCTRAPGDSSPGVATAPTRGRGAASGIGGDAAPLAGFYRPKAPPSTRMTMPSPIRTIGNSTCSQRSSTSAIGLRVATKRAAATNTATRARKTTE